jgi:hypothetical protein
MTAGRGTGNKPVPLSLPVGAASGLVHLHNFPEEA